MGSVLAPGKSRLSMVAHALCSSDKYAGPACVPVLLANTSASSETLPGGLAVSVSLRFSDADVRPLAMKAP